VTGQSKWRSVTSSNRPRALDLADGVLGGIVAWYSIIHTPPQRLPVTFAEFGRVLSPGGHLLLAFQAGDEGCTWSRPTVTGCPSTPTGCHPAGSRAC
jgi:hypothetical protein